MRLRYVVAAMSCLAGCAVVDEKPADTAIVTVSEGVDIVVNHEGNGLWTADPKSPSAYRRWGMESGDADDIAAIEMHTGCKIDRNTLVNFNLTVRARVLC